MSSEKERPTLISILAIIYFVIGLMALIGGILTTMGIAIGMSVEEELRGLGLEFIGIGIIVYGLIMIIVAGGFWNGWKIMWYIGVIVSIIGVILGVASIVFTAFVGIIPLIIDIIILWYLFRPPVKEFFEV
jgi:hypothetical protein